MTEQSAKRCALSRGDLLRTLAAMPAPLDSLTLDHTANAWFGYRDLEESEPSTQSNSPVVIPEPDSAVSAGVQLKLERIWAQFSRLARPASTDEALPHRERSAPLDANDLQPVSRRRLIRYQDLVPGSRLFPVLRNLVGGIRAGRIDVAATARALAEGRLRWPIPRHYRRSWQSDLVVVLDFSRRLTCYRMDMHKLARELLLRCGRGGVSLRVFGEGAMGTWSAWSDDPSRPEVLPSTHDWQMPPEGSNLLLVSDLGLHLGSESPMAARWLAFVEQLKRARLRPLALAPISEGQLAATFTRVLPVLRWSPDALKSLARGSNQPNKEPAGLPELLAMVSALRRVDPPLLRKLRQLNSVAPHDAGLEGALCSHTDVNAGWVACIRSDRQVAHMDRFANLELRLRAELDALRRRHHAHLQASLHHEESLLWARSCTVNELNEPHMRVRVEESVKWFGRMASSLSQVTDVALTPDLASAAQGVLARADGTDLVNQFRRPLHDLAAALWYVNPQAVLPSFVEPSQLPPLLHDMQAPVWFVLDKAHGVLRLQTNAPMPGQTPLCEPINVDSRGLRIRVGTSAGTFALRVLPIDVAPLNFHGTVALDSATESLEFASLSRPLGAYSWHFENTIIAVDVPPIGEVSHRFSGKVLRPLYEPSRSFAQCMTEVLSTEELRIVFGIDNHFGVFADIYLERVIRSLPQRFRWIEPGEFLMGSPQGERGSYDDEHPQHQVRISEGFWLADSACTQAFWLAVMGGDNPSHFSDDLQNPVEKVSWEDVQQFLQRLQQRLPDGSEAILPTEAQWECACRAGTQTPFNLGDNISTEQVNYAGDFPYADGTKGEDRQRTVPVKSLPSNRWGLYEMHGNVWEWCADGLRDYEKAVASEALPDPGGPTESASRAVRGGAWFGHARHARSANRRAYERDLRIEFIGFRLALRSRSPASPEGGPRSGGPEARGFLAPEAPANKRRDAAPALEVGGVLERLRKKP